MRIFVVCLSGGALVWVSTILHLMFFSIKYILWTAIQVLIWFVGAIPSHQNERYVCRCWQLCPCSGVRVLSPCLLEFSASSYHYHFDMSVLPPTCRTRPADCFSYQMTPGLSHLSAKYEYNTVASLRTSCTAGLGFSPVPWLETLPSTNRLMSGTGSLGHIRALADSVMLCHG